MRLPKSKEKLKELKQKLEYKHIQKMKEINNVIFEIEMAEHKGCARCRGLMSYLDRGTYDSDRGYAVCYFPMETWDGINGKRKEVKK